MSKRFLSVFLGLFLVLFVSGCESAPVVETASLEREELPPFAASQWQSGGQPGARPQVQLEGDDERAAAALSATQDHADRLVKAISQGAAPAAIGGPPVRWIDVRHPVVREEAEPFTPPASSNVGPGLDLTPTPAGVTGDAAPARTTAIAAPAPDIHPPVDQKTLTRVLLDQIRQSDDPALIKALNASAACLINDERDLPAAVLEPLDPRQRELVEQYHQAIFDLARQIAAGDESLSTSRMTARLADAFSEQPLVIRSARLCRRVDGFGVYEPFAAESFLAGRDQPMIIYLELEHFKSIRQTEFHEVRLAQEIVLYNEADGLAVWRLPKETIVDRSRNQRRDFYTVKLIRLPARLGVGKYILKMTVSDLHSGTVAETSLDVRLVADETLVVR